MLIVGASVLGGKSTGVPSELEVQTHASNFINERREVLIILRSCKSTVMHHG